MGNFGNFQLLALNMSKNCFFEIFNHPESKLKQSLTFSPIISDVYD